MGSGGERFPRATVDRKVAEILAGDSIDGLGKLQQLSDTLREVVPHYNWFGFYIALPDNPMLVLGPFSGEPTEHTHIPFGRGICGQAAQQRATFLVPDVSAESNYLACSLLVKSEIVVPIIRDSRVIGEIDIDSHRTDPFTPEDIEFLEQLARKVEPLIPVDFPN
ncbi:MAG TPA: GAF domain-containing protein [Spirochaetia bacterium]|nr:GAF domain-containing protein [Spirochaetia bacterium]